MRIAIIKPDYKIVGGFEIVVQIIEEGLKNFGHDVEIIKIDMLRKRYELGDFIINEDIYNKNEEFFRYTMSIKEYEKLNLSNYDLIICTQPPSFAINHPNIIVLFYHHLKIYYDLYDVYLECIAEDKEIHEYSKDIIRKIDSRYINNSKFYFTGSEHVSKRLQIFNDIEKKNIEVFRAGIDDKYYNYTGEIKYEFPICVGRHEFPKRPELFIHAMKFLPDIEGKLIGHGGKTEELKIIDKYLQDILAEGITVNDEELWKNMIFNTSKLKYNKKNKSNVTFSGKVSQEELIREYANSLCVVCPAFEEDYGLTAIEAMSFSKPVIVCNDGGGYVEFIKNGENGFIVEPTGEAIAEKIKLLYENKELAEKMGKNAYEFSRKYSWNAAIKQINDYISKKEGEF
jgi:glycosyltransferase involved in cell wall biosynthesis